MFFGEKYTRNMRHPAPPRKHGADLVMQTYFDSIIFNTRIIHSQYDIKISMTPWMKSIKFCTLVDTQ